MLVLRPELLSTKSLSQLIQDAQEESDTMQVAAKLTAGIGGVLLAGTAGVPAYNVWSSHRGRGGRRR